MLKALKSNPDFLLNFHESSLFEADLKFDKMRRLFIDILKEKKWDEILNELLNLTNYQSPKKSKV